MAETSKIEWTDATWNPITGCTLVSEGCRHCYAATLAATRLRNHPSREGLARMNASGEAKFTGEVRLNEQWLDQPLRWIRPRRIFVCAHGDLFHEGVPDEWIDRVFAVMALAPQHTFQVLTKRPERARAYFPNYDPDYNSVDPGRKHTPTEDWPLPNVWLGTSVEDQSTAGARLPILADTPAAIRFVSAEPLLGAISVPDALRRFLRYPRDFGTHLHQIIVGGESGRHARPMHPDWARSLRDQCQTAGVAFHFKQWGEWAPRYISGIPETDPPTEKTPRAMWHDACGLIHDSLGARDPLEFWCEGEVYRVGKARAGRLLDGREWNEMPGARDA